MDENFSCFTPEDDLSVLPTPSLITLLSALGMWWIEALGRYYEKRAYFRFMCRISSGSSLWNRSIQFILLGYY